MNDPAKTVETVDELATAQKLVKLVKENQLVTALILFALWQVGALASATEYLQGGLC